MQTKIVPKKTKAKGKKKKKVLSLAERADLKLKNDHRTLVRRVFTRTGFHRIAEISDKEFTFDNQTTDVDDVFVYENVVALIEYTTTQSSNVGPHLKNKKIIYDKILSSPQSFLTFLKARFPTAAAHLASKYHQSSVIIKILYCSRYDFDSNYKTNVPGPVYLDYPALRYFGVVTEAIKYSARYELLHFMGIDLLKVGNDGAIAQGTPSNNYTGSILPEAHSNFAEGFKVVSFYADANALLQACYVLRKDGWRDSDNLYQRMISAKKIESIRAYLKAQKRVFINNIIVTLPSDVHPLTDDNKTIDTSTLVNTAPVKIQIPSRANSIGIIDGQHRVFAYHQTAQDDPEIAQLRVQQNLLITGIIYPPNIPDLEREKFEAKLFLEINSTQTNAKADLKQAIGLVIAPFSNESVAARVLSGLSKNGPLANFMEQNFYDVGKLKTSSIVSYGLRPLVKMSGNDSLFSIWQHSDKAAVANATNSQALLEYTDFCVSTINSVLGSIRCNLASRRWTADRKIQDRVISTTYINSFLIVIRMLIERGTDLEHEALAKKFSKIGEFDFSAYRSSQYNRMAEKIMTTIS